MATMPQSEYLLNESAEQPKPKLVPKPNTSHAAALLQDGVQKVEVRTGVRRPKRILLGTLNHCDFRVIKAIPVHLDVRGETVIASWREVDEFGTGKSTSLACDDLGRTVAELYASLKADEPRLGPDLAKVWGVLQEYVEKRRPLRP